MSPEHAALRLPLRDPLAWVIEAFAAATLAVLASGAGCAGSAPAGVPNKLAN